MRLRKKNNQQKIVKYKFTSNVFSLLLPFEENVNSCLSKATQPFLQGTRLRRRVSGAIFTYCGYEQKMLRANDAVPLKLSLGHRN